MFEVWGGGGGWVGGGGGGGGGWEAQDEILMKNCHVTDEVRASPSVIWRQKTDTKSASNGRPHCCQEIGAWLEQVYYVEHLSFLKSAKIHITEEERRYKLRWRGIFKIWHLLFGAEAYTLVWILKLSVLVWICPYWLQNVLHGQE